MSPAIGGGRKPYREGRRACKFEPAELCEAGELRKALTKAQGITALKTPT
ncbi:MAG: hypothetical protein HY746_08425 [Elusimicrobia bacterium]|nr:hypothetical protein [Elusimicrobiota bacterium]